MHLSFSLHIIHTLLGYLFTTINQCHQTWFFTLLFLSIFNPTSSHSLQNFSPLCLSFSYVCLSYASFTLTTIQQGHNLIGNSTTSDLLSYQLPKAVHFLVPHPILRWNLFGCPLTFPPLKVQDFPNTECKEWVPPLKGPNWSPGSFEGLSQCPDNQHFLSDEKSPTTLWTTCWFPLEQGKSPHHPLGSQQHHPKTKNW